MQKRAILTAVSLLLLVTALPADARKKPLTNPATIALDQTLSMDTIQNAVNGAMVEQSWVVEGQSEAGVKQTIEAALYVKNHKILVAVNFNTSQIDFGYLDSENMKFKEKKGRQYIHPNYMVWAQKLADQIASNVAQGDQYVISVPSKNSGNTANPPPVVAFDQFTDYKLEPTTLSAPYQGNKGNLSTIKNLNHNLNLKLQPVLDQWSTNSDEQRTLVIQPHIMAVRFIGTGARIFAGAMAGRSWIMVKIKFTDEATGEVIASPELYRLADRGNGFSLSARDYKMVENMAADIKIYMENNHRNALGGGRYPPADVKQEILTE